MRCDGISDGYQEKRERKGRHQCHNFVSMVIFLGQRKTQDRDSCFIQTIICKSVPHAHRQQDFKIRTTMSPGQFNIFIRYRTNMNTDAIALKRTTMLEGRSK